MIGSHTNVILQFSGGKDSTALLYLARPYLDRIEVVFVETGATFPHVVTHVRETCEQLGARLTVISPPTPVTEWIAERGLPSDVVPVESTVEMAEVVHDQPGPLLQSYAACCGRNLWVPMLEHIRSRRPTLVLRGAKESDSRGLRKRRFTLDGVEYDNPLWAWTDGGVYTYLRRIGASLPDHYPAINDSLDCWLCTAHLKRYGREKLQYIRDKYPHLWPEVARRVEQVKSALSAEARCLEPAFKVVESSGRAGAD